MECAREMKRERERDNNNRCCCFVSAGNIIIYWRRRNATCANDGSKLFQLLCIVCCVYFLLSWKSVEKKYSLLYNFCFTTTTCHFCCVLECFFCILMIKVAFAFWLLWYHESLQEKILPSTAVGIFILYLLELYLELWLMSFERFIIVLKVSYGKCVNEWKKEEILSEKKCVKSMLYGTFWWREQKSMK